MTQLAHRLDTITPSVAPTHPMGLVASAEASSTSPGKNSNPTPLPQKRLTAKRSNPPERYQIPMPQGGGSFISQSRLGGMFSAPRWGVPTSSSPMRKLRPRGMEMQGESKTLGRDSLKRKRDNLNYTSADGSTDHPSVEHSSDQAFLQSPGQSSKQYGTINVIQEPSTETASPTLRSSVRENTRRFRMSAALSVDHMASGFSKPAANSKDHNKLAGDSGQDDAIKEDSSEEVNLGVSLNGGSSLNNTSREDRTLIEYGTGSHDYTQWIGK